MPVISNRACYRFTGQLTSLGLQRRSAIALARGQSLGVRFTEFTNSLHIAVSPEKSFQRFPLKDDLVQRRRDKKKKAHLQSPEPSVPRSRRSREVPPSSILSSQNHSRCSSDTWEKTSVNIWSWILFALVVNFFVIISCSLFFFTMDCSRWLEDLCQLLSPSPIPIAPAIGVLSCCSDV